MKPVDLTNAHMQFGIALAISIYLIILMACWLKSDDRPPLNWIVWSMFLIFPAGLFIATALERLILILK